VGVEETMGFGHPFGLIIQVTFPIKRGWNDLTFMNAQSHFPILDPMAFNWMNFNSKNVNPNWGLGVESSFFQPFLLLPTYFYLPTHCCMLPTYPPLSKLNQATIIWTTTISFSALVNLFHGNCTTWTSPLSLHAFSTFDTMQGTYAITIEEPSTCPNAWSVTIVMCLF
jgi:hypothetical protein